MASKIALIVSALTIILLGIVAVFSGSVGVAAVVILLLVIGILGIVMSKVAAKKAEVLLETVENSSLSGGIAVRITIRNGSIFPILRGQIRLKAVNTNFGFEVSKKEMFSVAARSSSTVVVYIQSEYCGKYQIVLEEVQGIDPWGITGASICKGLQDSACMYPKRYSVGKVSDAIKQTYEKEKKFAGKRNNNLSDILQYREYQRGDNLKNVNWKLSVKHDQLLVREFDTPIDNQLLILLDINEGDPEYQNMAYNVMFSLCSTYIENHHTFQICWQDGDRLQVSHIEDMETLLVETRKVLSAEMIKNVPAASIFESQERKEKYARILYVTNALNSALEHRLRLWGNAELIIVDDKRFSNKDLRTEMQKLVV